MLATYLAGSINPSKSGFPTPWPTLGRPDRLRAGPNGDGLTSPGAQGRPFTGLAKWNAGGWFETG